MNWPTGFIICDIEILDKQREAKLGSYFGTGSSQENLLTTWSIGLNVKCLSVTHHNNLENSCDV